MHARPRRLAHRSRLLIGAGFVLLSIGLLGLASSGGLAPSPSAGESRLSQQIRLGGSPAGQPASQRSAPAGLSTSAAPRMVAFVPPADPAPPETVTLVGPPALLLEDWRFSYDQGIISAEIQALLEAQPGPLKQAEISAGRQSYPFAETLVAQSALYGVNPRVVLALIELRTGLLSSAEADVASLERELRLLIDELYEAQRDYPSASGLDYADGAWGELPAGINSGSYPVLRALARDTSPGMLEALLGDTPGSFIATYRALFGVDPREPLGPLPAPAQPFLSYPKETRSAVTSFFDHSYPLLIEDGSLLTYWGRDDREISYDGHSGWDYSGISGGPILAAAPGTVLFAGYSDDGCWTPAGAVVLDHGNGYRTLYWHLGQVDVQAGQQIERYQRLGSVGSSGCATGPHLHFQVSYLGRLTDPYGWCGDPEADPWAAHPYGVSSRWLWLDRPSPCEPPDGGVLVAAGGAGFSSSGEWRSADPDLPGGALWASSATPVAQPTGGFGALGPHPPEAMEPARASWRPSLPAPGRYRVLAHIPYLYNGLRDSSTVYYRVSSSEGVTLVEVNQRLLINEWADLGTYEFDRQGQALVELTSETGSAREGVWAGAMVWLPVE